MQRARSRNALESHREIDGIRVPNLLYGTAWKEERTRALTALALETGFRGIDTANQRRHYFEAAVGEAVQEAIANGLVKRSDLFLQTKFTYRHGQDHRLPYDVSAPLATQVEQSFASSLGHFGVDRLDAYLLHGPTFNVGLNAADWEVWRAMERLHDAGKTRILGISNVSYDQLEALFATSTVKPRLVQNRCFTRPQADAAVRAFCKTNRILYEGFSLLTAIAPILQHPTIQQIAARTDATVPQVLFRYCLEEGMIVLTGTSSKAHMMDDLRASDLHLQAAEIDAIDALVSGTRVRL
jgi:diketogulonate reductase-like aldo/keto reductase